MKAWIPWGIIFLNVGAGIEALLTGQWLKAGYWFSAAAITIFATFM